jgi:hypothetical protein
MSGFPLELALDESRGRATSRVVCVALLGEAFLLAADDLLGRCAACPVFPATRLGDVLLGETADDDPLELAPDGLRGRARPRPELLVDGRRVRSLLGLIDFDGSGDATANPKYGLKLGNTSALMSGVSDAGLIGCSGAALDFWRGFSAPGPS